MRRRDAIALAFLCGAASGGVLGVGLGYQRWHEPPRVPFETLLALAKPVDTLVLGDSITAQTMLDRACGLTFNAGVGGARAPLLQRVAAIAIPRLKPKTIVVAVGTNYFWQSQAPLPAFRREYLELLDGLPPSRLILAGVPLSVEASRFVRDTARARGAVYVPPVVGAHNTTDGAHLTPAGTRLYRSRLIAACRQAGGP